MNSRARHAVPHNPYLSLSFLSAQLSRYGENGSNHIDSQVEEDEEDVAEKRQKSGPKNLHSGYISAHPCHSHIIAEKADCIDKQYYCSYGNSDTEKDGYQPHEGFNKKGNDPDGFLPGRITLYNINRSFFVIKRDQCNKFKKDKRSQS